jgi:glycerol-3-phosphate O-acyltransferase
MGLPENQPPQPPAGVDRKPLSRVIQAARRAYPHILPRRPGRLRSLALRLFYSGIRLEESQARVLRELPTDGIVVFTARFRSAFSFLFAYTRFQAMGLPFPTIGLGCQWFFWQPISRMFQVLLAYLESLWRSRRLPDPLSNGFIGNELLRDRSGFLPLIEKRSVRRWFRRPRLDAVEFLILFQKTIDRPILLVPQLMFFSRKPRRARPSLIDMVFGPEDEPGRLRLLAALFKTPGNVFVEISPPIDLRRFLARPEIATQRSDYQAAILRGEILAQIDRHRQSITGPVRKSRAELKEHILNSQRFQQIMQAHAESHQMPLGDVRAQSGDFVDEISAALSPNWIRFYSGIVGWIFRTIFDGVAVDREGLAAVKRMAVRAPLVFVPSHKSHVDYLLLSYVLYHHDLSCPLVAAGKNLSFWPIGPLFRRGGAFFIRRSFKGAVLYSRTFAEYVHTILEEGHSVEQFIEGGRSRTGKALQPKLGLLSMLLTAQKKGACEDLTFVPVAIGYDRVLEEASYLEEIGGGQKQPENVWQVIKARKFLQRRYGKVYLQFATPISVNDLAGCAGTALKAMTPEDFSVFCRSLGHRIVHAFNQVSVVTPHALSAAAILNSGRERLDLDEALAVMELYLNHLIAVGAKLADTLILDHRRAVRHALGSYAQRKILEPADGPPHHRDPPSGYLLNDAKRPLLEYYKNTCVAFFIPAAFTALAILQEQAFQFSASDLHTRYEFLQDLFQCEFVFDLDAPAEHHLRAALRQFIEDAVLIPHPSLPDTYNVTAAGFRKLRLFAMFMKTFLESYGVVLSYLRHDPADGEDAKTRIRKIVSFGNRMHRLKEIENREALSKVTYENALEFFTRRVLRRSDPSHGLEHYAAGIDSALRCLKA